jgi:hypothetical protein
MQAVSTGTDVVLIIGSRRDGGRLPLLMAQKDAAALLVSGRHHALSRDSRLGQRIDHSLPVFGDHIIELRDNGAPLDPANVMLLCGASHANKTDATCAARAGSVPDEPVA